ncbi:ABC transporter ATP-binding protein [Chitinophaga pendula]|uniref:ABC transporter ATP-binding protein n=1 Tax=Chitinophaga pendula TaxID=2849666 RepID=UPI001CED88B9|nr:ABC transporter ATP-binding protein [Chitinophaga pendula]UCJ08919.1 ABC transporter ATP-binding protein [Chitinophaga pendula]
MSFLQVVAAEQKQGEQYVLQDISFTQLPLQHIAIAGETGSGKSTLMKAIGGLVQLDAGQVLFEGNKVKGPLDVLIPGHPGIAYLSQHFELRHNYYVEEVLSYADKLPVGEAEKVYEVCRISHLLQRRTEQVSGGEKQRIALARLLVTNPRLLLLDEPYSNLDMIHKGILKSVIADVSERLGTTCILVSHDPLDILSWAELLLIMRAGKVVQQGAPQVLYHQPVDEYVAALLGIYNLIDTALIAGLPAGKRLFLRPEQLRVVSKAKGVLAGKATRITWYGSYEEVQVNVGELSLVVRTPVGVVKKGGMVYLGIPEEDHWFL